MQLQNVMSKRDRHLLVYFVVWVGNKDYVMKMPFLLVWGECRVIQVVSWLLGPSLLLLLLLLHCCIVEALPTHSSPDRVFFLFWPGGLTRCYSSSRLPRVHRRLVAGPCTSYVAIGRPIPSSAYTRSNWYPLHSLFSFRALHLQTQRIGYSSWKTKNKK